MPTAEGIYQWLSGEVRWWFLIGFLLSTGFFCFKRAWIAFALFLAGSCFVGVFALNPEVMLTLPAKLAELLKFS